MPSGAQFYQLAEIFYPVGMKAVKAARINKTRFGYYTTADVGVDIVRNEEIWMRNTRLMNDWQEFQYGFQLLNKAYSDERRTRLDNVLEACFPGLSEKVRNSFNAWIPGIERGTYITCISEHAVYNPAEDQHGRLSMWRAYGGRNGVAFIFNGLPFYDTPDNYDTPDKSVGVVVSPVAYLEQQEFNEHFESVTSNIERNRNLLIGLGEQIIQNYLFEAFRMACLCTKHPGFKEEQEWRLLAAPTMWPSELYVDDIKTVRGVPQAVLRLGLKAYPHLGKNFKLTELLDRIIIGPCDAPDITSTAFVRLLDKIGFENSTSKVIKSEIPLRHF